MDKVRKPGRPRQDEEDTRGLLIEAAKVCFTKWPYDKVTTRKLADHSGVNAGLIRYYFVNKEGLYKAMFQDMVQTVTEEIRELVAQEQVEDFEPLFRCHAKVFFKYPEFPKLMFKELQGEGICQEYLIENIASQTFGVFDKALTQLQDKGKLKPGINPKLLRLSIIRLMAFPTLNFHIAERIDGMTFNENFLDALISHNLNLLKNGCFNEED